jgi:hypothetical protein
MATCMFRHKLYSLNRESGCDEALQHTLSHKNAMCDEVMPSSHLSERALRSNATAGWIGGRRMDLPGAKERELTTSFVDQWFEEENNVLTTGYIRD